MNINLVYSNIYIEVSSCQYRAKCVPLAENLRTHARTWVECWTYYQYRSDTLRDDAVRILTRYNGCFLSHEKFGRRYRLISADLFLHFSRKFSFHGSRNCQSHRFNCGRLVSSGSTIFMIEQYAAIYWNIYYYIHYLYINVWTFTIIY